VSALTLPRLVGGRSRAKEMLAPFPSDLTGANVVLDCRDLLSAPPSFADELVRIVLAERHADSLEAIGAGPDFAGDLANAAAAHDVVSRLRFEAVD
jgi:hypothetical protein